MPRTKYPVCKCLHQGERGFTLLELLIVIAILGIIVAVVIPNISTFRTSGTLAAANTEAENVKTAALGYRADYNQWPESTMSTNFTNYLTGDLKAEYKFDPNTGFIYDATIKEDAAGKPLWQNIHWEKPAGPPYSCHGKWVAGKG